MQSSSFVPADTYRVSVLAQEIKDVLQHAYSSIWVAGEAQRLQGSANGHWYFELVEKGPDDQIVGRIGAVLWRGDRRRLGQELDIDQILAEGQEVRCRGNLDFYGPRGSLQFIVREIDPIFTLGLLAKRRQEVIADLRHRQLANLNREHELPSIPLEIGLVTAADSAAYHDFLSSLQESGFGFRVTFAPATVQGVRAERELAGSLRHLSSLPRLDCIALVRGGGSRSDLAAFDSLVVSEAICRARHPVLAGLGHEIDQSVSDLVAHSSFKTPTAVAEFLVQRIGEQETLLKSARRRLLRQALMPIQAGQGALRHAVRGLRSAQVRLGETSAGLQGLGHRLGVVASRRLTSSRQYSLRLAATLAVLGPRVIHDSRSARQGAAQRLVDLTRSRSRESSAQVEALARLLRELSPLRTLQRGFSLTRNAAGRAVRRADEVSLDEELTTELASGTLASRVTVRHFGEPASGEPEAG